MSPRVVAADDRIDAVRGCVAVERGPEVLCAESPDQSVDDVAELVVDTAVPLREEDGLVVATGRRSATADRAWPYPETAGAGPDLQSGPTGPAGEPLAIVLTPYHDWANRGPSTMRIWLPTT